MNVKEAKKAMRAFTPQPFSYEQYEALEFMLDKLEEPDPKDCEHEWVDANINNSEFCKKCGFWRKYKGVNLKPDPIRDCYEYLKHQDNLQFILNGSPIFRRAYEAIKQHCEKN